MHPITTNWEWQMMGMDGDWVMLNARPDKETEKVEKEAHWEPECTFLLGVKERCVCLVWQRRIRGWSGEKIRGGGTWGAGGGIGSEGEWHYTGLGRHRGHAGGEKGEMSEIGLRWDKWSEVSEVSLQLWWRHLEGFIWPTWGSGPGRPATTNLKRQCQCHWLVMVGI